MASPVGHLFAGLLATKLFLSPDKAPPASFIILAAVAPDFDMVCALWLAPEDYGLIHGQITHNFGSAFIVGLCFLLFARFMKEQHPVSWFSAGFLAYSSHLLVDLFYYPHGMQIFLPLSDHVVYAFNKNLPFLRMDLGIVDGLLYLPNWITVFKEVLFYGGAFLVFLSLRKVFAKSRSLPSVKEESIAIQRDETY